MKSSTRACWPPFLTLILASSVASAEEAWKWSGSYGDDVVEILIIGDIQVRRPDPPSAFVHVRETLLEADLVYANLEGSLVPSRGPGLDLPDKNRWVHPGPEGVAALEASNIDVVGVANNVAYGRENILKTLQVLEGHGIAYAGAGKNIEEAHRPAIVERKGTRIGFLQYTARWYIEEEQIATETEPGVARILSRDGVTIDPSDLERLRKDVKELRAEVDIVVVSHHNRDGGTPVQFGRASRETRPSGGSDRTKAEEYQKQFAHVALDSGADLVFGHGTHTVQGVELYQGKPILYALGHSAFDQPGYEESTDGLFVRVVARRSGILRVSFVPVTRDEDGNVMMLDPGTGEGARLVGIVKGVSGDLPLPIEGREVVLLDPSVVRTTNHE